MLLFNDTKIIKNKRLLRNKFKNNELQLQIFANHDGFGEYNLTVRLRI